MGIANGEGKGEVLGGGEVDLEAGRGEFGGLRAVGYEEGWPQDGGGAEESGKGIDGEAGAIGAFGGGGESNEKIVELARGERQGNEGGGEGEACAADGDGLEKNRGGSIVDGAEAEFGGIAGGGGSEIDAGTEGDGGGPWRVKTSS